MEDVKERALETTYYGNYQPVRNSRIVPLAKIARLLVPTCPTYLSCT